MQRRNLRYDEGDFQGQANGGKVQELLKAVLDDTAKEEADAHKAEQDSCSERCRKNSCVFNKNSKILKDRSDESQTKVRRKSVKPDQQQSLDIEQSSLDSHSSNKFPAGASTHDRLSLFSLSSGVLDFFHMHLHRLAQCFVLFCGLQHIFGVSWQ